MKRTLSFFFVLLISASTLLAQNKITREQGSTKAYYYKLSDKEAKKMYEKKFTKPDKNYFHTLTDSCEIDKTNNKKLTPGHYLVVRAVKNNLTYELKTVSPFSTVVLNNYSDLHLKVLDTLGTAITNAKVKVNGRTIPFNKQSQTYTLPNAKIQGLLSVSYNGFTSYQQLKQNTPIVKHTPFKNLVSFVGEVFESIEDGYPTWRVRRFKSDIQQKWDKIFHPEKTFSYRYTGYIVFNKPKYLPNDSVKVKAFIEEGKTGKLLNVPVDIYINTNEKDIKLGTIKPYNKGGYAFAFPLHDSLNLTLDRNYAVSFRKKGQKKFIYRSSSFKYEDYELKDVKLSVRKGEEKQYKNDSLHLFVKGTNENNMNLRDARLLIEVRKSTVSGYFEQQTIIKDGVLYTHEMPLAPKGETKVSIPPTVFPAVNMRYSINITLLTSDNQKKTATEYAEYIYRLEEIKAELRSDTLKLSYFADNTPQTRTATIAALDRQGHYVEQYTLNLPCDLIINPYVALYQITTDGYTQNISVDNLTDGIQCKLFRENDSIQIGTINPRKLIFNYYIYRNDKEIARGYGTQLEKIFKSKGKANYYVSLQYLWAGRVESKNYALSYPTNNYLTLNVTQPEIVFPGQKVDMEIQASYKGKPLKNVDISAFSYTKKFGQGIPAIPYTNRPQAKGRKMRNEFTINPFDTKKGTNSLTEETKKLFHELDTMEYYKFINPKSEIYRYSYPSKDSLTQFAPFVVNSGRYIEPILLIYVDYRPVYFAWTNNLKYYSFPISAGKHRIELRTKNSNILIDSLHFKQGEKTIISIDKALNTNKLVHITKLKKPFNNYEVSQLASLTFPYTHNFDKQYAYLRGNNDIVFLANKNEKNAFDSERFYSDYRYTSNGLAGPVFQTEYDFVKKDDYITRFRNQSGYSYLFEKGLLKMTSHDIKPIQQAITQKQWQAEKTTEDLALTEKRIYQNSEQSLKNYYNNQRRIYSPYSHRYRNQKGNGKIELEVISDKKESPLNYIFFQKDSTNSYRIYNGNSSYFYDFEPGTYRLLTLYTDARYSIVDSIVVETDATTHMTLKNPTLYPANKNSKYWEEKIIAQITSPLPKETNVFISEYIRINGNTIKGHVYDEKGEPLPGASVNLKDTNIGTVTDINGAFTLNTPIKEPIVIIKYIGYEDKAVQLRQNAEAKPYISILLKEDTKSLDEVVVVGYGTVRKDLTSTVSSLSGRVAGVRVQDDVVFNIVENDEKMIRVRGGGSITADSTPLYIVDGIPVSNISGLSPEKMKSMNVLKDASATAIYGARGANGVIVITTQDGNFVPDSKAPVFDDSFAEAAYQAASMRSNFSDAAYWQPSLRTDKNGKAKFTVTFPDDVTNWSTYVIGMTDKKRAAVYQSEIKSFKPIMGQLSLPRFLVHGDTAKVIGKALNYTSDTLKIKTTFTVDGNIKQQKNGNCIYGLNDTLNIVAPTNDSLSVSYKIERDNGYFDGESRHIPLLKAGIERAKGVFAALDTDTIFTVTLPQGTTKIYLQNNELSVLENEIKSLMEYRYLCNEQMASKLFAYLAYEQICQLNNKPFTHKIAVEKLIRDLSKNQNEEGGWSWWNKGTDSQSWITAHVLKSLRKAEKMGYKVIYSVGFDALIKRLVLQLEEKSSIEQQVEKLLLLQQLNANIDYKTYTERIDTRLTSKAEKTSIGKATQFDLIRLKQVCGLTYKLDSLQAYQDTTMLGNVYFSNNNSSVSWRIFDNEVQLTLKAYEILQNDSTVSKNLLRKIRNWFYENRGKGTWGNTYQSAQIIDALLPNALKTNSADKKAKVILNGVINETITTFPYEHKYEGGELQIGKTGLSPVFFTAYQNYWERQPEVRKNDFEISSSFANGKNTLTGGKAEKFTVKIKVKKDAEFVQIEIPIPAGCSYESKNNAYFPYEVHREFYKNQVAIFCQRLPKGEYSFDIELLPRFTGNYILNPAKVELMYFPTFNANNEMKRVVIK
jgi:TonB-dependent SusC/RagA subfamily outer membrane receptor